jgi:hypothetical protein
LAYNDEAGLDAEHGVAGEVRIALEVERRREFLEAGRL